MTTPHDLTPIEPASAVEDLCDRLDADIGSFSVGQEVRTFRETRTPRDGRKLVNALRQDLGREDLAQEVLALLVAHRISND